MCLSCEGGGGEGAKRSILIAGRRTRELQGVDVVVVVVDDGGGGGSGAWPRRLQREIMQIERGRESRAERAREERAICLFGFWRAGKLPSNL